MSIIESSYIERLSPSVSKKRRVFKSVSGTGLVPVYEYQIIDGVKTLVLSGEKDFQAEIDSFAESTDIHVLLERFLNGDTSVIRDGGVFGDFTDVPSTYAEMFSRLQKCENVFNSLPVDIREKFDNSYQKFWSEFGSDYFNDVFNEFNSLQVNSSPAVDNPSVEEKGVNNAE